VGQRGRNDRIDVMLVQYMLFKLLINPRPNFEPRPHHGPFSSLSLSQLGSFDNTGDTGASALFPIRGIYQPALDDWIRAFQASCNRLSLGPLVTDGRVDPGPVGWGPRARGQRWKTIHALNTAMENRCAVPYAQLPDLPDVPADLRDTLRRHSVTSWG